MSKMTETELELISNNDIYIYSLIKEWEEVFLALVKDRVKQIINTCSHMIIKSPVNISHI